MKFEKVIDGINRYLNSEIYSGMNDWQEVLARIAVSRFVGNTDALKQSLVGNPFIKTFAIMDSEGNVDIDGLARDLRQQIEQKSKIEFNIPMFGKYVFTADDVDKLYNTIVEV